MGLQAGRSLHGLEAATLEGLHSSETLTPYGSVDRASPGGFPAYILLGPP